MRRVNERLLIVLAVTLIVTVCQTGGATDASAAREKERQRLLVQHLEAEAIVAESVQKLAKGKQLDVMERAQLERAVHDLQQGAQAYRQMAVW